MKITILGSRSGTEPMQGRHNTSWTLEVNGSLYFFDAGEDCCQTAVLDGMDLFDTHAIFISHPHIDHFAGIPNLLWTMKKFMFVRKLTTYPREEIKLLLPDKESMFNGMASFLHCMEPGTLDKVPVVPEQIADGVIYADENITVEAIHNGHLRETENWHSYSFRIACQGKHIIYSGDIARVDELDCFLSEPCDLFLMETGHHHPWDVGAILRERRYPVKQLTFLHHGRDILYHLHESKRRAEEALGAPVFISEDNMTIRL